MPKRVVRVEIARIGKTYHAWRGEKGAGKYADVSGFRKSAATDEISRFSHRDDMPGDNSTCPPALPMARGFRTV
ncbi:MAG: hypothetical protein ABSG68_25865 [Thermoguttaceae bacterium]|jgi:hypothetical protein